MGQGDRAWAVRSRSRSSEHLAYLETLIQRGHIASDWVRVMARRLNRDQAYTIERSLIEEYKPSFNKDCHQRQMSNLEKSLAETMREDSLTYKHIGEILGYHWTTIRHHLNKKEDSNEVLRLRPRSLR